MTVLSDPEKMGELHAVLAGWDIPPVTAIGAVDLDNPRVFKVATAGPAFTLKDISDAPNLSRLAFTQRVLTHVAGAGLQVPVPILSRSGQPAVDFHGRVYLLSAFIEADHSPPDVEQMPELFYETGQATARLHQALAAYPDPDVSRQTWRTDLAGNVAGWISALSAGLPAPQAAVVQRMAQAGGAGVEAALRGLPEQLIHRDCHPGNILLRGTRVIGFIDCDHLSLGPRLFDLASYAIHHLKWVTDDPAATQRWLTALPHLLAGYRSRHDFLPQEAAALPHALLAYHLLLAHWFMTNGHWKPIALELRSLDWINTHFDIILDVIIPSQPI